MLNSVREEFISELASNAVQESSIDKSSNYKNHFQNKVISIVADFELFLELWNQLVLLTNQFSFLSVYLYNSLYKLHAASFSSESIK